MGHVLETRSQGAGRPLSAVSIGTGKVLYMAYLLLVGLVDDIGQDLEVFLLLDPHQLTVVVLDMIRHDAQL